MSEHPLVTELRELLAKYDASITFSANESSDWHGITGEAMTITINDDAKTILRVEGNTWLDQHNTRKT